MLKKKPQINQFLSKLAFSTLLALSLIGQTSASSLIVSTVKNPDPYSGNQSWFRYYQNPGNQVEDSIILRNLGDQTETISLYATDATSNQVGSFTPKMEDDEQKGLGLWTTLEKNSVTLSPQESTEVKFKINIPANIVPGQYFGSIMSEQNSNSACSELESVNDTCQGNIQIKTRTGNRIYLTIPGEIKQDIKLNSFTWKSAGYNSLHFQFSFTNNGNVAFEPKAVIQIFDMFGNKVDTVEATLGKSLPGTTITPMLDWKYKGQFGSFTAQASIYYQEDDQGRVDSLHGSVLSEQAQLKLFVVPWVGLTIGIVLIVILGLGWTVRQRFYQKILSSWENYNVQDGDNLIDLASSRHSNWKLIACINKIKAPYVIFAKQKIKIPPKKKEKKSHEK